MTAANFRALAIGAVAFSAAALSAGCNLEPGAHDKPTYEADVRPIFMSRCIRCHGSPPLADPTATVLPGAPIATVRFDVFGDTDCNVDGGGPQCVRGAAYEASTHVKFQTFLNLLPEKGGMPPAPAPALTSYQRDTILNWEQEDPPLEK